MSDRCKNCRRLRRRLSKQKRLILAMGKRMVGLVELVSRKAAKGAAKVRRGSLLD